MKTGLDGEWEENEKLLVPAETVVGGGCPFFLMLEAIFAGELVARRRRFFAGGLSPPAKTCLVRKKKSFF